MPPQAVFAAAQCVAVIVLRSPRYLGLENPPIVVDAPDILGQAAIQMRTHHTASHALAKQRCRFGPWDGAATIAQRLVRARIYRRLETVIGRRELVMSNACISRMRQPGRNAWIDILSAGEPALRVVTVSDRRDLATARIPKIARCRATTAHRPSDSTTHAADARSRRPRPQCRQPKTGYCTEVARAMPTYIECGRLLSTRASARRAADRGCTLRLGRGVAGRGAGG